jgi:hypothetical protein
MVDPGLLPYLKTGSTEWAKPEQPSNRNPHNLQQKSIKISHWQSSANARKVDSESARERGYKSRPRAPHSPLPPGITRTASLQGEIDSQRYLSKEVTFVNRNGTVQIPSS